MNRRLVFDCGALVALLASYPFSFLTVTGVAYLAHIPFAWRARNRAEMQDRLAEPHDSARIGAEKLD